MSKIIVYAAMSLDGYLADPKGKVDWLCGDGSQPEHAGSYPAFFQSVSAVVMGYRTYHQIVTELSPEEWVYKGKRCYVLTRKSIDSTDDVAFTHEAPASLIASLKEREEKDIWICGGAQVIKEMMDENLVDQYHISIIPMILGDGITLFGKRFEQLPLRLISTRQYNGIVDVVYQRREFSIDE